MRPSSSTIVDLSTAQRKNKIGLTRQAGKLDRVFVIFLSHEGSPITFAIVPKEI